MSVENVAKTWGRLFFKAVKMSPHHYKTVGKILYNSATTGADWLEPVNELLASNMEQLTPYIKEFERAFDAQFNTDLCAQRAHNDYFNTLLEGLKVDFSHMGEELTNNPKNMVDSIIAKRNN